MRRCGLLVVFLLASTCHGQVDIAKENRIRNIPPGYCAWCCLETLGWHHKIKPLCNLVHYRYNLSDPVFNGTGYEPKHAGTDDGVAYQLDKLGVKYKMQRTGDKSSTAILTAALKAQKGVMVGVYKGALVPDSPHAILLLHMTDKVIHYCDSNHPENLWIRSREWFDQSWTGFAVVVGD